MSTTVRSELTSARARHDMVCLGASRSSRSDRSVSGGSSCAGRGCAVSITSSVLIARYCDGERIAATPREGEYGRRCGESSSGNRVRGWKQLKGRASERSGRRGSVRKLREIGGRDLTGGMCGVSGRVEGKEAPGSERADEGTFWFGECHSRTGTSGSDSVGECLRDIQSTRFYRLNLFI